MYIYIDEKIRRDMPKSKIIRAEYIKSEYIYIYKYCYREENKQKAINFVGEDTLSKEYVFFCG